MKTKEIGRKKEKVSGCVWLHVQKRKEKKNRVKGNIQKKNQGVSWH